MFEGEHIKFRDVEPRGKDKLEANIKITINWTKWQAVSTLDPENNEGISFR